MLFPGQLTSPDPASYPYGCDVAPSPNEPLRTSWVGSGVFFLTPWVTLGSHGDLIGSISFDVVGDQYLGYAVRRVRPLSVSWYGAFGMWVQSGIEPPPGLTSRRRR